MISNKLLHFIVQFTLSKLSEPEIRAIWDNTARGGGCNNLLYRRDIAGAFIKMGELNQETKFGWVIEPLMSL